MGTFKTDAEINLHGLTPDAALYRLRRTCEMGKLQGKTLLVIHGHGRGILRDKIRQWATESQLVKKFWPGEDFFLPGGAGVTIFFL